MAQKQEIQHALLISVQLGKFAGILNTQPGVGAQHGQQGFACHPLVNQATPFTQYLIAEQLRCWQVGCRGQPDSPALALNRVC